MRGLRSYGLYSYGLYCHGLYSYGLRSDGELHTLMRGHKTECCMRKIRNGKISRARRHKGLPAETARAGPGWRFSHGPA